MRSRRLAVFVVNLCLASILQADAQGSNLPEAFRIHLPLEHGNEVLRRAFQLSKASKPRA